MQFSSTFQGKFQASPPNSSTFQACANPDNLAAKAQISLCTHSLTTAFAAQKHKSRDVYEDSGQLLCLYFFIFFYQFIAVNCSCDYSEPLSNSQGFEQQETKNCGKGVQTETNAPDKC